VGVIVINDMTGGESDLHASQIEPHQLTIAQDIDFYRTKGFNRRNGSVVVVAGLASEINTLIVHRPTDEIGELWALDASGVWASFSTDYVRTVHTPSPAETFTEDIATGATLHGKLFLAARTIAPSGGDPVNRLHVWDGTTLRRTGLIAPAAAPGVADAGSGTFTGRRYYRVRYIVKDGDKILRRSEPSPEIEFNPSGSGATATITKPAATDPFEGETHWEVEESEDLVRGNWYRIATLPVATPTYDDTITLSQYVPTTDGVVLSADIGDYNLQVSYRWVVADRDRLIGAGNFEDPEQDAAVEWSVVGDDVTGVGNDERRPIDTGNRLDLDGQVSGPVTGLFNYDGRIIVSKLHKTYELTHTGIRESAYLPRTLSNTYGSLPFSGVEGVDKNGAPVLYFVDPNLGPMALTHNGFQVLAAGHLHDKFRSEVNFEAAHVVNAVYHAKRHQVWWHFAGVRRLGRGCCPPADDLPQWGSFRWVYDVRSGGSSFHSLPRLCHSSAFWPDKPVLTAEGGGLIRCDHEDAADDYGYPFRAYARTRAFQLPMDNGSILNRWGVNSAVVEGRSVQTSPVRRLSCNTPDGVTLAITLVRDYGKERRTATFNLDQEGNEEYQIVSVDDARMAEATAMQVEIGDPAAVSQAPWVLYRIALRTTSNGPNVS
jgi:hypothetical protein